MTTAELNAKMLSHIDLAEVRLHKVSCCAVTPTPAAEDVLLLSRISGSAIIGESGATTVLFVDVEARTRERDEHTDPEDDPDQVWTARVEIACDWTIRGDYQPSEAEWHAVSQTQGVLTAFPYARQHIQYLSSSMGYQAAVLDLLRSETHHGRARSSD